MNNALFRSLIVFGICIVLAVWLGFMLAGPLTYSSMLVYGLIAFVLVSPLLLKWHYPLLLLCWNFAAVVPFMPGRPPLGITIVFLSLGISVMQRMISREHHFVRVPQLTLPLFFLLAVVAVTARLTGFGFHIFGSNVYGGHKYFYLMGGILGYFALTAQRIPPRRRNLYLALFFLGGISAAVEDLVGFLPRPFYFIYTFFNYNFYAFAAQSAQDIGLNMTRFQGAYFVALAVFSFMLVRYGIRGIFLSGKPWRWMVLLLAMAYGQLGGFRSLLLIFVVLFAILFFLEGLHRTRLMAVFMATGMLVALALIPFSDQLPYTFQRAISFLPYKVSTAAKLNAQESLDWRLGMWSALLPQIPKYLLLGKGYNINPRDYEFVMGPEAAVHSTLAQNDPLMLAEDFHNGPISILIPFGIWGAIAFLWIGAVGMWALRRNYRYGDVDLKTINAFLLAAFATRLIVFLFIGGDLSYDMMNISGFLGLSIAFNGGVARRVRVVQPFRAAQRPRGFVPATTSPTPAFQRRLPGTGR